MRSATSRRASGSRTSIFCKVKHFFAAASFLRDIFAHCKQTKQLRLADLVCRLLVYIQQNTLFFIARADQMPANPSFSLPQSTATSTFPPIYAFFGRPFSTAHAIWSAKTAKTPSNLSPKAAIRQTKHTFCQSLVCSALPPRSNLAFLCNPAYNNNPESKAIPINHIKAENILQSALLFLHPKEPHWTP